VRPAAPGALCANRPAQALLWGTGALARGLVGDALLLLLLEEQPTRRDTARHSASEPSTGLLEGEKKVQGKRRVDSLVLRE
jgi:hypothetical protein